eukprot:335554-Chlamydomonas_euryale.AAC.6
MVLTRELPLEANLPRAAAAADELAPPPDMCAGCRRAAVASLKVLPLQARLLVCALKTLLPASNSTWEEHACSGMPERSLGWGL